TGGADDVEHAEGAFFGRKGRRGYAQQQGRGRRRKQGFAVTHDAVSVVLPGHGRCPRRGTGPPGHNRSSILMVDSDLRVSSQKVPRLPYGVRLPVASVHMRSEIPLISMPAIESIMA